MMEMPGAENRPVKTAERPASPKRGLAQTGAERRSEPRGHPRRGADPKLEPPRNPIAPPEENPPRPIAAPLIDPPPRDPPCIWASKGAADKVADNAAMADQRRIARIIAPASAPVCQIFVGSRRSRRVTAFSLRGQDALGTAGGTPALQNARFSDHQPAPD